MTPKNTQIFSLFAIAAFLLVGTQSTQAQGGNAMTIETVNGVAQYPDGYLGTPIREPNEDPFLSPTNSALVLIDYQPHILQGVRNVPHEDLINNTIGLVKSAVHFGLPIVFSHVGVGLKGAQPFLEELVAVAPDAVIIDRTNVNAWEEAEFVEAVKAMGRKKLIMGGLCTDSQQACRGWLKRHGPYWHRNGAEERTRLSRRMAPSRTRGSTEDSVRQ